MNQDILLVLATFCDRATLGAICRVSQDARSVATRRLYRTVRVRTLNELVAVHGVLARDVWLLPLVLGFFYDDALGATSGSTPAELTARRLRAFISGIVPRLTNLKAFALDCEDLPVDLLTLLAARLATLPRLRSLKLLGIGSDNLQALRAYQTPLEDLCMREYGFSALNDWISDHSATLQTLHIDNCDLLARRLAANSSTLVFPRLYSLVLSNGSIKLSAQCSRIFPAVRSLSVQRPVSAAEASLPMLEHLDACLGDPAASTLPRPYGPAVTSLRLTHTGHAALGWEKDWASPQISALALVVSIDGFAAHVAALGAFPGLRMLDVTLLGDRLETDAGRWLANAASSLSGASLLEVLTVRGATELDGRPPPNPLDKLSQSAPTIKLVRIILQLPPERFAFAPSGPVDWLSACEMVADYLPHWRETRAPWDDIRDI